MKTLPPKKEVLVSVITRVPDHLLAEFDEVVTFLKEKNPDLKWSRNSALMSAMMDWIEQFKDLYE